MATERVLETEECPPKQPGRPRQHWRIRVVRIDAQKHPEFAGQGTNPFAQMAVQARVREIDAFCARLWARTKKKVA
jgi:hypothetical protein